MDNNQCFFIWKIAFSQEGSIVLPFGVFMVQNFTQKSMKFINKKIMSLHQSRENNPAYEIKGGGRRPTNEFLYFSQIGRRPPTF